MSQRTQAEPQAPPPEHPIREHFDSGRLESAATAILQNYGSEIQSFLAAKLSTQAAAQEAFSMFCEDLWLGLPKFAWRCSARTWAYTLARNAAARYASAPHRRPAHNIRVTCPQVLSEMAEHVRTTTLVYQRTEVKDRFQALRDKLDAGDQMVLLLRIDRNMSWREVALTLGGDPDLPEEAIARSAARLRKAFERIKAEVKRLAKEDGLL